MTNTRAELKVSVFSDYICPFCYIGSRRLLRLNQEYDLKVNWCGLEIHPETPAEGMPVENLGYARDTFARMMHTLQEMAAAEGLDLRAHDFTTNSHDALLLAEAAKQAGREVFYDLHERLFDAYFRQGRNIADREVLRQLASESAVPETLVQDAWQKPQYNQRLQLNLKHAGELRVRGTPTYVFGQRVLVGAVSFNELKAAAQSCT